MGALGVGMLQGQGSSEIAAEPPREGCAVPGRAAGGLLARRALSVWVCCSWARAGIAG